MAPLGSMLRSLGLAFESTRVSIPATGSYCLATLMGSDRTKQICLWMTIYIYIYIYVEVNNGNKSDSMKKIKKNKYDEFK